MRIERTPRADSGPELLLGPAAAALYGDLRQQPLLERLLDQSGALLRVAAGSISLVDDVLHRYTKAAERGAACRRGQSFPLDEGVTGQVTAGRRPVVLRRYDQVRRGHLTQGHPAHSGGVVAVPMWWLGRVIGVNVAFAGCDRRFTAREVDELELLSQLGAAGIVATRGLAPSLAEVIRRRVADVPGAVVVTEAGVGRAAAPDTARAALELVDRAAREARRRTPSGPVRVAVVHRAADVRLLVHAPSADGPSATDLAAWQDVMACSGGAVRVQGVPGWGLLLRADFPHPGFHHPGPREADASQPGAAPSTGLTRRESEVLGLLAEGLTDRQVADRLRLSHKTVEKHVGTLLRKTATSSRTGAVMRALHLGWLPLAPLGEPGRA